MTTFAVQSILEKMASRDKDYRYMATQDLFNELQKETFKMDADGERKVCMTLLKQLEDSSGDIQGLAFKCLSPLVKKVHENQIEEIVDTLCGHVIKGKEEQRDIGSMGLKTVVAELPANTIASSVAKKLVPKLVLGIKQEDSTEVKQECLDILTDLLKRFGGVLASCHEDIQNAILPQLAHSKPAVRKKAISAVGALGMSISDKLLASLIDLLLQKVEKQQKAEVRTYIQTIGAVSRTVGYRLGKFLDRIVPLFVKYCNDEKTTDDELRENCLQALESFVLRCPKEITAHVNRIVNLSLVYVKYDPNYQQNDDDDDVEAMDEDDEEASDEENSFSDDDDVSWKVRRATLKCLDAVINTRPDLIIQLHQQVAPVLISRFREREESVKLEVFQAFVDLLKQTAASAKRASSSKSAQDASANALLLLRPQVPAIVKAVTKQLKEKSVKTRVGGLTILRELVTVLPNALSDHIATVIPYIKQSFLDKGSSANLKIETLMFVRVLLASHPPEVFRPRPINEISAPVFASVSEKYYKITAEALRVCSEIPRIIRGQRELQHLVKQLYQCTLSRLTAQDQDQEVKEAAITCMGVVIAVLGDDLHSELKTCLPLMLDRVRNEITRLTAVKAIACIAESDLTIDLNPVLSDVVNELSSFLRKANRGLKQVSLTTLDSLVRRHGQSITPLLYTTILNELAPLISDSDLHLSHLALRLCVSVLHTHKGAAPIIQNNILPKALVLVRSPLLQGLALQSLLNLFGELVRTGGLSFEYLLDTLLSPVGTESLGRQASSSLAQSVAVLCQNASQGQRAKTVASFVANLSPITPDPLKLMALMCLGEIGRHQNLSIHGGLHNAILASFESPSEEIKAAASFSLGNVAVGNMQLYLPVVLEEIQTNTRRQYLLLHSLKELISKQSSKDKGAEVMCSYVPQVLPLLFKFADNDEEGVRNVVGECLGKLALIQPDHIVPKLEERVRDSSAHVRQTVTTALKFALSDTGAQGRAIDVVLQPRINIFMSMLTDPDLKVRRAALLTFNSAAHNKPGLIRDLLPVCLPALYGETAEKAELVRQVDLGPFKHKVDDGLDIRKAAFECMDTLLDTCLERLDTGVFIHHLISGLRDNHDIKMLAHLMLSKLAQSAPSAVLAALDSLVDPLKETVTATVKENAVKQEVERNDDVIKSALRAVDAVARVPESETCKRFDDFLNNTVKSGKLLDKFNTIRLEAEMQEHSQTDIMDTSV